jgi:hypothetical protein
MKHFLTGLLCSALCATALPAAAEGERSARAEALFQQGQALLVSGKLDEACAKLEASEAWENSVETLFQLGDCYQRAGRSASAWHAFLEVEAMAQAQKDSKGAQLAETRVAELEPQLARVVLVVPPTSRVPDLSVQLGANTIPASSWGKPIPVDAGSRRVSVFAKGHRPWSAVLDISANVGREYRITVPTLEPLPAPNTSRRSAFRTAGVVTGSMGLAGIGAGAVFSALSKNADDAGTCVRGVVQCTPNKTNADRAYSEASTVSLAVGGALLATGVTLFVLSPSPDNEEKHALRVAAHVASNGGRLQLEGAW